MRVWWKIPKYILRGLEMKNGFLKSFLLLLCFFAFACVPPVYTPTENFNIGTCLGNPDCTQTLTVAHRGNTSFIPYAPENTLAAYEFAWKMGADSIEVDVQSTKDGELVIMHDDTVDRTTNGSGRVEDMTLAEIKELKVISYNKDVPNQHIPTFREALSFLKGKTMIYVDIKTTDIARLVEEIQQEDMIDSCYLLIYSVAEGCAARSQNAFVSLLAAVHTKDEAQEFIDALSPIVMFEMLYEDIKPDVADFIHSKGIKIHMDALGEFDIMGKFGFKLMLNRGVDSIQSDRIDILVPYLRGL
jgi:glycerophosphoryl diester phosphodiesterase